MIYQMATGELPFVGATALEEMAKVVNGKFTPPNALRADLPKELVVLINKTLERKPDKRFQSAEELLLAIEKLQRTVLEPAGTTELKAWLAALAQKDKEQPLSRKDAAPAPAVPENPTTEEVIELQDEDVILTTSPSQKAAVSEPVAPARGGGGWKFAAGVVIAAEVEAPLVAPPLVEVPAPPPTPRPAPTTTDEQVSVMIESEPAGAEVRIDNRLFGTTPVPLKLKVGIAFELAVSRSGFREQKVRVTLARTPSRAPPK